MGARRRREVEEGLLLLGHAALLQVRNRVLVDVLTAAGPVDPAAWPRHARRVLEGLHGEAEASWRALRDRQRATRDLRGEADHEHDYRARDFANLDRRRRVARTIARRTGAWADDPARVDALVADARRAAAADLRAEIGRLTGGRADRAGDEAALLERLALLSAPS